MTTPGVRWTVDRTTPRLQPIEGDKVTYIAGTLSGGDAATDFPIATPTELTTALRGKLNAYTGGSALQPLRVTNAAHQEPVVFVRANDYSPAAVLAAVNAFQTVPTLLGPQFRPTFLIAPELTWRRAANDSPAPNATVNLATGVDPIATALDTIAGRMRCVAIASAPMAASALTADAETYLTNAVAWQTNNRHDDIYAFFPRVGVAIDNGQFAPTWTRFADFTAAAPESFDMAPYIAAYVIVNDERSPAGVGDNLYYKRVDGAGGVVPVYDVQGDSDDDSATLAQAYLNTLIRGASGLEIYGMFLGRTDDQPDRFVNNLRVAYRFERRILDIARGLIGLSITDPAFYTLVTDRVNVEIDAAVASGQLTHGGVARAASDVAGDNTADFALTLGFNEPALSITFNVRFERGAA